MPCQQGDFEVERVVVVGADDRLRIGDPGCGQTFRGLQRHDSRAGVVQLLDDPHPERIVTAHDDVAAHLQNATAEKPVAKGEDVHMPTSPKIYVKACINGARTPDQHPNLPVTPEQLAAEALAAHGAGAKAVHMHPKTADGVDSLLPQHVDAAVACGAARGTGPAARGDDGVLGACPTRTRGCAPSTAGPCCPTSRR